MKIKDYLHLYIGCECFEGYNAKTGRLMGICITADDPVLVHHNEAKWWLKYSEVKPILRPLSDMKEEEKKEIFKLIFKRDFPSTGTIVFYEEKTILKEPRWVLSSGVDRVGIQMNGDIWADSDLSHRKFNPHEITRHLLKQHFDLFGLIGAGLAIDKTKQT